jgi:hypothetical protein
MVYIIYTNAGSPPSPSLSFSVSLCLSRSLPLSLSPPPRTHHLYPFLSPPLTSLPLSLHTVSISKRFVGCLIET